MSESLEMWLVFDHPVDAPGFFVARKRVVKDGQESLTGTYRLDKDLDRLRTTLEGMGLFCVPRMPGDEPKLIEVWM